MHHRDYHHRKAIKSGSSYHWKMYRKLRNFEIRKSKSNYYIDLIENSKGEIRKLWNAVNEVSCCKNETIIPNCIISDGVQYMKKQSIASILNKHFASIGKFLANKLPKLPFTAVASTFNCMDKSNTNLSVRCHSFPNIWKSSKVIAIFKSGKRTDRAIIAQFQYCQL